MNSGLERCKAAFALACQEGNMCEGLNRPNPPLFIFTETTEPPMIEGLKVTIVGTELRDLCATRAEHHRERAQFYAHQKQTLPDLDEDSVTLSHSKAPHQMMQDRSDHHTAEADELTFIAAHIDIGATYLLTRDDLYKLGICKGRY